MSCRTARCRHGWRWYAECQDCADEREAEEACKRLEARGCDSSWVALVNEIVGARRERFTYTVKL